MHYAINLNWINLYLNPMILQYDVHAFFYGFYCNLLTRTNNFIYTEVQFLFDYKKINQ